MFADTSRGSLCAALVTEIAAAKQSTAQIRMVIRNAFRLKIVRWRVGFPNVNLMSFVF
jgi:hypothetical protein